MRGTGFGVLGAWGAGVETRPRRGSRVLPLRGILQPKTPGGGDGGGAERHLSGGWGEGTLIPRAPRPGFPLLLALCSSWKTRAFPPEQQLAPACPAPSGTAKGVIPDKAEPASRAPRTPLPSSCPEPREKELHTRLDCLRNLSLQEKVAWRGLARPVNVCVRAGVLTSS